MSIDFNNPPPVPAGAPASDPFAAVAQQTFDPRPPGQPAQFSTGAGGTLQPVTDMAPEYVDLDEMRGGFEPLPPGSYQLRIATIAADPSKKGDQMVTATFEVVAGAQTGREIRKWYITSAKFDPKTQKWNSRGVADARADITKLGLGATLPKKFPTNGAAAARIIGTAFQSAGIFTGMVRERSYQDKTDLDSSGNPKTKTISELVVAAPGAASVTPAGNTNTFGL
jgi:hypothetical protein